MRVAGTVKTGLFEFDSSWAYLPIAAAQRLFEQRDQATLVEVRLDDMFAVREGSAAIIEELGHGYLTTDWVQLYH